MINPWHEYRVMKFLHDNADKENLKGPCYPIHIQDSLYPDVILGPAGVDPGLATLNIIGVNEVVQKLIADGYLEEPIGFDNDPDYYEIHFTNKGRYYFENLLRSVFSKFFWSVILPILLALITTLITLGLSN